MNLHFFKKQLEDFKWSIVVYALIVSGYTAMIAAFFPTVRDNAEDFKKLLESYPKGIVEAFGLSADSFTSLEGFLSIDYLSFAWVIIVAILIFSLGASIAAGEIDKGTSEFSYALPCKRWKIALGKLASSYLIYILILGVTLLAIIISGYALGEPLNYGGLGAFSLVALAMGFFLLMLSAFVSSFSRTKGRVYGILGGFFGVSYLLHILDGISEKVGTAYYFSFLKYYGNTREILTSAKIEPASIEVLFALGAIFLILSLVILEKRDL